jgi:hypothetical protein
MLILLLDQNSVPCPHLILISVGLEPLRYLMNVFRDALDTLDVLYDGDVQGTNWILGME